MARYAGWMIVLLVYTLSPQRSPAQEKKAAPKPLLENWKAAYSEGLKIGYLHFLATEVKKGDQTLIRTTRTLDLVFKRYGSVVPMRVEQTTDETRAGKVVALKLVHSLANDKKSFSGEVQKGQLLFRTSLDNAVRKLPWNDESIGQYAMYTSFQRRKAKAGDKFKWVEYQLPIAAAITLRVTVKGEESVDQLVTRKKGDTTRVVRERVRLRRVDAVPDSIEIEGQKIPLPVLHFWLDAKQVPVREQWDWPGVGPITFYTTTKEAARKAGVAPELLPDLGLTISIPVKQTIERPYDTTQAVYRITLTEPLARVFVEDDRQQVRNKKGKTFELVVRARHAPDKDKEGARPGKEYLSANHFLESDNPRVKALAKKAVGSETDPWKKAKRVEKWVHDNMKLSTATGFPTAAVIARDLEGDCRQHALLSAAMCRAAGVPSRTAIGLVYNRDGQRSQFSFHMWTEVWVKGQWLGLDAIIGKVGATHLKLGEHSWDKTVTLAPLLPIANALGKVRIEVISTR